MNIYISHLLSAAVIIILIFIEKKLLERRLRYGEVDTQQDEDVAHESIPHNQEAEGLHSGNMN